MQEQHPVTTVERVDAREVYSQLRQINVFSDLREEDAGCLGTVQILHAPAGSVIYRHGDKVTDFWGVVKGEVRGVKKEDDGSNGFPLHFTAGECFGEVPLLTGRPAALISSEVMTDSTLIGVGEEGFWKLLASCPVVRRAIVANLEMALHKAGRRLTLPTYYGNCLCIERVAQTTLLLASRQTEGRVVILGDRIDVVGLGARLQE